MLYVGYYARDQMDDLSNAVVASKVSGVAFLCFMAQVPCESDEIEKMRNASLRATLFSRKTILLLCYIYIWHTGIDQSRTLYNRMERNTQRRLNQTSTNTYIGDPPPHLYGSDNGTVEW